LIAKKLEGNDFRMTVDVRAVNTQTERMVWPMPMLKEVLGHVGGASVFFRCISLKAIGSFNCMKTARKCFHFSPIKAFTPRADLGGSNSVAHCQATVQAMFERELYKGLLIWLDDAKNPMELLAMLERVLAVQRQRTIAKPEEKMQVLPG
jgi:hypothetical protein